MGPCRLGGFSAFRPSVLVLVCSRVACSSHMFGVGLLLSGNELGELIIS